MMHAVVLSSRLRMDRESKNWRKKSKLRNCQMMKNNNAVLLNSVSDEEPEHGCCCRIVLCPLALLSGGPACCFIVAEAIHAPLQCVCLVVCKATICSCCCPEDIHHTFRNVICTPCRWIRISCVGRGEKIHLYMSDQSNNQPSVLFRSH